MKPRIVEPLKPCGESIMAGCYDPLAIVIGGFGLSQFEFSKIGVCFGCIWMITLFLVAFDLIKLLP